MKLITTRTFRLLRGLALVFFLSASCSLFSQSPQQARVDSLIQNLPLTKDSVYHFMLRNIAHFHPNFDSSYHYIQKSFAVAQELDNTTLLLKSHMEMGKWYFKQGQYKASIPFFDSSFLFAQVVKNPESETIALGIKANALALIGEVEEAKNTYSEALDICTTHNLNNQAAILYMRLGDFYGMQGDHEKAIPLIKKADRLLDSLDMLPASCNCKYSLASSQMELVQNKEEYYPIIELLEYVTSEKCERFSNPGTLASAYSGLGDAYSQVGQHARAEKHLQEGLKRARTEKYVPIITFALGNLAVHYGRLKNKTKALETMLEAEQLAKETDFLQIKTELVKQKSNMYTYLGEVDNAVKATKEYLEIKTDQLNEENLLAMEELNIKYNTLQQEKEITQQKLTITDQKSKFNSLLLVGLLFAFGFIALLFWYSLRLKNKRLDAQRLEELNRLKTNFFTNISHEFRTPLTLIITPLKKYLNQTDATNKSIHIPTQEVATVLKNTNQLQQLINQVLDLSRIESQEMALSTKAINLSQVVNQAVQNFSALAQEKEINLQLEKPEKDLIGLFDQKKIETILNNLLSNALKFTPNKEQVLVQLKEKEGQMDLVVRDTGNGISKEHLPNIFDRFYQADHSISRAHGGSGIGLALTKELVLLHNGKISADSQLGQGTTFSINLPFVAKKQIDAPQKQEALTSKRESLVNDWNVGALFLPQNEEEETNTATDLPLVLIVEDHPDMRRLIKQELQADYQILEADNGTTGFELARQHIPDLIISDVMMPGEGKDGLSLTKALKQETATSHIPVILLTAKATSSDQISGLELLADDYITKPFDLTVLMARVKNLILQRRKLKVLFAESIQILSEDLPVSSLEENFIQQVMESIEQNLAEEAFGVEQLGQALLLSRTQLFRKVKALTGKTPGQLLKETRLQRAKYLLENRVGNVSQVAQSVGYRNPEYFSTAFKKAYGILPSEILKRTNPS